MGWSYGYNQTREQLIESLTKTWDGGERTNAVLAKSLVGKNLWTAWSITDNQTGAEIAREIVVFLLDGRGHEWGYKPVSESMGPAEVNCPLKFLKLVPENPNCTWAHDWRERVRAYRATKKRPKSLAVGDVYRLPEGYNPRQFRILSIEGRRIIGISEEGHRYRLQAKHINAGQKVENEG